MLSSHLFLCLSCLLPPFTVPCKMVLARPDERETCPCHCSLRLFTMVRRSSFGPIACWILARTSSLVTWSFRPRCNPLRIQHFYPESETNLKTCIPLCNIADCNNMRKAMLDLHTTLERDKNNLTAEKLWNKFKEATVDSVQQSIPHKTGCSIKSSKPWVTPDIKKRIKRGSESTAG